MSLTQPSVAAVRAIITTTLTDEQVQSFIDDAALMAEGLRVSVRARIRATGGNRQIHDRASHQHAERQGRDCHGREDGQRIEVPCDGHGRSGHDALLIALWPASHSPDTTGCLAQLGKVRAFGMNI